jgi:hypothetical protein
VRRLALCLILIACSACSASALVRASAEPTACPEQQLEISDAHLPLEGPSSWTATCRAPGAEPREWFCSRAGEAQRVICTDVPR